MKMLVNIAHDIALLDHFREHYLNIGITEFHIGVFEGGQFVREIENWAWRYSDHVRTHRFEIEEGLQGARDSVDQNKTRELVVALDEWYAVADLDEFVVFNSGATFPEKVEDACGLRVTAVTGGMYDRVTPNGYLPDLLEDDIWDQFPVCLELTKHLVRGNSSKMVLARGDVPVTNGHHADPSRPSLHVAQVHHFKWRASVVEMLKKRMAHYKAIGGCWLDCQNVLDHLRMNGGFLNIEELTRRDIGHRMNLCREVVELRERLG